MRYITSGAGCAVQEMTGKRMTKPGESQMRILLAAMAIGVLLVSVAVAQPQAATVAGRYPYLCSGALVSARLVDLPPGVILRSGEMKITQKDLDAEIRQSPKELWPQLKRNLFFVLENSATNTLLRYEATTWAKQAKNGSDRDKDGGIKAYLSSLTSALSVSDDEAKSFYDKNKDTVGDATYDQAKDQIKQYLLSQKRDQATGAHVAGLSERYEVDVGKAWVEKQYSAAIDNPVDKARGSGMPTLVDFGADGCRPCDMLAPIIDALRKEYAGKLNVLFVHVRKEQILAARYGVQVIPVQVFYDKDGKEVFRHLGFLPKDQIAAKLNEMGVK